MKFVITSPFGGLEAIRNGVPHTGIDLGTPLGTTLRSITNGTVEKVMDGSTAIGKGVVILTEDGTRHIFGHLSKVSVRVGEKIFKGETVGLSGSTGHSTGAHLHFGIWKDGEYQDPTPYIEEIDRLAGENFNLFQTKGILTQMTEKAGDSIREKAKEETHEIAMGILEAIGEIFIEATLIISGVLILLRAVGFKHAWIRPGVVITLHALLRTFIGGSSA
jgi:hypothetical protein